MIINIAQLPCKLADMIASGLFCAKSIFAAPLFITFANTTKINSNAIAAIFKAFAKAISQHQKGHFSTRLTHSTYRQLTIGCMQNNSFFRESIKQPVLQISKPTDLIDSCTYCLLSLIRGIGIHITLNLAFVSHSPPGNIYPNIIIF